MPLGSAATASEQVLALIINMSTFLLLIVNPFHAYLCQPRPDFPFPFSSLSTEFSPFR